VQFYYKLLDIRQHLFYIKGVCLWQPISRQQQVILQFVPEKIWRRLVLSLHYVIFIALGGGFERQTRDESASGFFVVFCAEKYTYITQHLKSLENWRKIYINSFFTPKKDFSEKVNNNQFYLRRDHDIVLTHVIQTSYITIKRR